MSSSIYSSEEIRDTFLSFFEERNHMKVDSSSLIPNSDPTILFTNAGMNQFKDLFLGLESREYTTAVTCQKCVRAGGKHNDLDNVGFTARHHTFFEMLGNFSFGDYFKKEAIKYSWEYITEVLKLDKTKLFATVHHLDEESLNIWHNDIGLPLDKIEKRGDEDNFWAMGDVGPCGYCSEIHYDRGEGYGGATEEEMGDRYLEVWNLVFMEFNKDEKGERHKLSKPSIDTGMGIERICSILQDTKTNYETDLFLPTINYLEKLTGKAYTSDEETTTGMRVIADHIRSISFLLGDGAVFSNEGRGYVLRRILRRAVRFGNKLGLKEGFLYKVADFFIEQIGNAYPDLKQKKNHIIKLIKAEELLFLRTLASGMRRIDTLIEKSSDTKIIDGKEIFLMYDTYGFPVDLLEIILKERGDEFKLDKEGFDREMEKQRNLSKASLKSNFSFPTTLDDNVSITKFLGYSETENSTTLQGIYTESGEWIDSIEEGQRGYLVLEESSFYAESGGQVGDTGSIESQNNLFVVEDTQRHNDVFYHHGYVKQGAFTKKDKIDASIDKKRRKAIQRAHSSAHLMHSALFTLIDENILQAGSFVEGDRLRFDFNYSQALSKQQIHDIEASVNKYILDNLAVTTDVLKIDEAMESGAKGIFEEKYGEYVRVLSIGDYSKELCGGTHVQNSGDIGLFIISGESSSAAGIRRLEALTGLEAYKYASTKLKLANQVEQIFNVRDSKVVDKIHELYDNIKDKDNEIGKLKSEINRLQSDDLISDIQQIEGINVLSVRNDDTRGFRGFLEQLAGKVESPSILIAGGASNNKGAFGVMVSKDIAGSRIKAPDVIKGLCSITGGSGGGKPDFAQAGAEDITLIDKALLYDSISDIINKMLK